MVRSVCDAPPCDDFYISMAVFNREMDPPYSPSALSMLAYQPQESIEYRSEDEQSRIESDDEGLWTHEYQMEAPISCDEFNGFSSVGAQAERPRSETQDDNDDSKLLTLTPEDVQLFVKVLRARRRNKNLKQTLREYEESWAHHNKLLLETMTELDDLEKRRDQLPRAEKLERLRLQVRTKELQKSIKESHELWKFKEQRRQKVTALMQKEKQRYRADKDRFFQAYEEAFAHADMLSVDSDEESDDDSSETQSRLRHKRRNILPFNPDHWDQSEATSPENDPHRAATLEELNQMKQQINHYRDNLDNRRQVYEQEDQVRLNEIAQGRALSFTSTVFGLETLKDSMALTRALINAEEAYREAKQHRMDLGCSNDFAQESDFADDPDDGYRESLEAETAATVNRDWIERWLADVTGGLENSRPRSYVPDAERAQMEHVRFGESLSVIAECYRNKEKLKWYRSNVADQRSEAIEEKRRRETDG